MAIKKKGGIIPNDTIENSLANFNKVEGMRVKAVSASVETSHDAVEQEPVVSPDENNEWQNTIKMLVKLSIEDRMMLDDIKNKRRRQGRRCTYASLIQEAITEWISKQQ